MDGNSLFPEEVDSYDPFIIRESLNNCIAHQDYTIGGKINVVEFEDRKLVFSNKGAFIPQTIENVLKSDAPEEKYRNKFLAQAMINLNLIDTIGSGIKKMFVAQKNKYFPLPEYELDNKTVQVTIEGKVLDINYASKLASMPDLTLEEIILLDKVQKGNDISFSEAKVLKAKKLMLEYLKEFEKAKKSDFVKVLLDKLPDILSEDQKKNKIKNYLQDLRVAGEIVPDGKNWKMAKK